MDDKRYRRYLNWHSSTLNIAKKPKLFQLISSRARRMFKRLLEPNLEKRPVSVLEANKYLEDRWLGKLGAEKSMNGTNYYLLILHGENFVLVSTMIVL